jgi:ADP-heptose:LPS heptosyltransferase
VAGRRDRSRRRQLERRSLAGAIKGVTRVQSLDAAWLAREGAGEGLSSLLRTARHWRARRYDLAINFEPDIRSNLVLANSGAAWTAGYWTGGGGPSSTRRSRSTPSIRRPMRGGSRRP